MTMLHLAFACICVFFVCCWLQNRAAKKHDGVLFPFCQLRRDVMRYRYEAVMGMHGAYPRAEREALRRLSRELDDTIHNYRAHKTVMFNLRRIMRNIQTYKHASKAVVDVTDNAEIRGFHDNLRRLQAKAFIAYTPMIKSEFAIKLIVQSTRFGYRAGKTARMRRDAEYVEANAEAMRNDVRRYGLIPGGATV